MSIQEYYESLGVVHKNKGCNICPEQNCDIDRAFKIRYKPQRAVLNWFIDSVLGLYTLAGLLVLASLTMAVMMSQYIVAGF